MGQGRSGRHDEDVDDGATERDRPSTTFVNLRLDPDTAARVRETSRRHGLSIRATLEAAMECVQVFCLTPSMRSDLLPELAGPDLEFVVKVGWKVAYQLDHLYRQPGTATLRVAGRADSVTVAALHRQCDEHRTSFGAMLASVFAPWGSKWPEGNPSAYQRRSDVWEWATARAQARDHLRRGKLPAPLGTLLLGTAPSRDPLAQSAVSALEQPTDHAPSGESAQLHTDVSVPRVQGPTALAQRTRMRNPQAQRRQQLETRRRIMAAARALHEKGQRVTQVNLARETRLNRRTIARHFPSSYDALGFALPGPWMRNLITTLAERPGEEGPLTACLAADLVAAERLTPEEEESLQNSAYFYTIDPGYRAAASGMWSQEWRHAVLEAFRLRTGNVPPTMEELIAVESVISRRLVCFEIWYREGYRRRLAECVADVAGLARQWSKEVMLGRPLPSESGHQAW